MLRSFWQLFPVFLVGFIARRICEQYDMGPYHRVVRPFRGVYFEVPKQAPTTPAPGDLP